MATHLPVQLSAAFPNSRLGLAVSARGGRCFAVRHTGSAADGDVIVAAPEAAGSRTVLVPRGLGRPLLARAAGSAWQAEATGEACSPRRWVAVGGLAARIRFVTLPRGPAQAVRPGRPFPDAAGPLLAIRLVSPAWAAVCRADASLAQGAVAVVDRFVRAVSPEAGAAGVAFGMSLRLARRHCPHLRVVAPTSGVDPVAEAMALLEAEVGPVTKAGGSLLVRLADAPVGELLGLGERLVVRLWQALGVRVRAAIGADAECASEVARVLDAEMLAYIPGTARSVWRRGAALRERAARGRRQVQIPDVEGVVSRARTLLLGVRGPGQLWLHTETGVERIWVSAGALAAGEVEEGLRRLGLRLGVVTAMHWVPKQRRVGQEAEQLPLLRVAR